MVGPRTRAPTSSFPVPFHNLSVRVERRAVFLLLNSHFARRGFLPVSPLQSFGFDEMTGDPSSSTANSSGKRDLKGFQDLSEKFNDVEVAWSGRLTLLERHGYSLRPRFRPGWVPSWRGTTLNPLECEDGHSHNVSIQFLDFDRVSFALQIEPAIDAIRVSDGKAVMIKRTLAGTQEILIGKFFSTEDIRSNPRNHCVPFLEVFHDDEDEEYDYIVMPVLRPFDDPQFFALGEAVEFVRQTLEVCVCVTISCASMLIFYRVYILCMKKVLRTGELRIRVCVA